MEHTYSKKKKGKVQTGKQTSTAVNKKRGKVQRRSRLASRLAQLKKKKEELIAANIKAYAITYCDVSIDWHKGQQLAACRQRDQCTMA